MSKLYINGGKRLSGEVTVQGAKNSALPILAATVLCDGESVIHNCPKLSDVTASVRILEHLGCICRREGDTLIVDSRNISCFDIPDSLMREMRSSIVLLGAISARMGRAKLCSPGGCELGPRPIDLHVSALKKLGLIIDESYGCLDCKTNDCLKGTEIHLAFPSVGATENIILAAATAKGRTVIHNAAREPEICDLQNFINSAGGCVCGAGTGTVLIDGVSKLHGAEHTVIPDRIVAATYLAAAAMTRGKILLKNIEQPHLISVLTYFSEMGCVLQVKNKSVLLEAPQKLSRFFEIQTMVYPGFPTDAGPILVAMATLSNGSSMFVENIFENRYNYVGELRRLGAKIKLADRVAVIDGVERLSGARVDSTDLRGGAALVLAGLAADGLTVVDKIHHIDRGYENIENVLTNLGADIVRKEV